MQMRRALGMFAAESAAGDVEENYIPSAKTRGRGPLRLENG